MRWFPSRRRFPSSTKRPSFMYALPVTSVPSSFQWTRSSTDWSAPTEKESEGSLAGPTAAFAERALRVEAGRGQTRAERERREDERAEHGQPDRQAAIPVEEAALPACRRRSWPGLRAGRCLGPAVAVLGRRLVRPGLFAKPLDLVDQEQDRPAGRLEFGVRAVLGEVLSPAAELVDLPCIHGQSMPRCGCSSRRSRARARAVQRPSGSARAGDRRRARRGESGLPRTRRP